MDRTKLNVLVTTVCIGDDYARQVEPAMATKRAYCARHGYPFEVLRTSFSSGRHPSWQKLPFLLRVLPHFDWVWMVDADVLVTNPKWRLESLIGRHSQDLILSLDCGAHVNCGSFFIRNCDWSRQLLAEWNSDKYLWKTDACWEQDILIELMAQNFLDINSHAVRVSQREFNSFYKPFADVPVQSKWRPGDFACHVSGAYEKTGEYIRQAQQEAAGTIASEFVQCVTLAQLKETSRCYGAPEKCNSVAGLIELIRDTVTWDSEIVDLGTYDGTSAAVFALFAHRVTTVDLDLRPCTILRGFDNIERAYGDSSATAVNFGDKSVDLVYIDADHSYEAVQRDIAVWLPKVKAGGFIAGHDYSHAFPGVVRAVCEKFSLPDRVYSDSSWRVRV